MRSFCTQKTMASEDNQNPQAESDNEAKQLCVSCAFPNDPSAHFCARCGAPLTSYASSGPFESIFAEGHVYRQAAEQPRSLIVVLGVWLIFGTLALGGIVMVLMRQDIGIESTAFGVFIIAISVALLHRTTRNYLARRKGRMRNRMANR